MQRYWSGSSKEEKELYEILPKGVKARFKAEVDATKVTFNSLVHEYHKPREEAYQLWRKESSGAYKVINEEYNRACKEIDEEMKVLQDKRDALYKQYEEKQNAVHDTISNFKPWVEACDVAKPKIEALREAEALALAKIISKYEQKVLSV
jgi:hypothetical protein